MAGAAESLHDAPTGRDRLWLKRPDGSELRCRFRTEAGQDRTQILLLSWFMRDIRDDGRAVWMEPALFDLLAGVQASMSAVHGGALPLMVTSGYRTPGHNAALENAARNSMHLYGYAADVQVRGYPPRAVALAASFFSEGGIGLYDSFTHLDVWQRRTWIGRPAAGERVRK
ncbi:hypothetical protein A5481_00360 [Methylobacterium platani]|uniref:Murein endopeptidase K n=1 Tax=Methylobacterium platani TaxID=427683 RepID=A0A179SMY4_9HYPH|nr:hypothetical protein A5481_00360 [Methylobacterium platani]